MLSEEKAAVCCEAPKIKQTSKHANRKQKSDSLPDLALLLSCNTVEDFAKKIKVGLTKAREIIRTRKINYYRLGRTIRISDAQILEYLQRTEAKAVDAHQIAQRITDR